jgi:hypothetical protein
VVWHAIDGFEQQHAVVTPLVQTMLHVLLFDTQEMINLTRVASIVLNLADRVDE